MTSLTRFALLLLLPLAGCADDGPLPGTGGEEGRSPAATAPTHSATAQADAAPVATAGTTTASARPTARPQAPPPPAPRDLAAVLRGRPSDARTLQAWAADAEATPQVRLAALRSLEARGEGLEAAAAMTTATSPTLRSNAVAVLARSRDPRADALIAKLPPRYRRLAAQLRQRRQATGRTQ